MKQLFLGIGIGVLIALVPYAAAKKQDPRPGDLVNGTRPPIASDHQTISSVFPPVQYPPAEAMKGMSASDIHRLVAQQVGTWAYYAYIQRIDKEKLASNYPELLLKNFIDAANGS
jgi:hypothetical protein